MVAFTVIRQDASAPLTLAVILQVPAFFAVISPYVLTEAMEDLLLLNEGCFQFDDTAVSWYSSPIAIVLE